MQRRVLVADDNRDGAEMLATYFRLCGLEVVTAYDGAAAINSALAFDPDVLVLDVDMPILTGLEVAVRLRNVLNAPRRFIALSGRDVRDSTFDVCLMKPCQLDTLLTLVRTPT